MPLDPLSLHLAASLLALITGGILYLIPGKGNGWHRRLGVLSAAGLLGTAISGFFLRGLNGGWSYLHILSAVTLVSVLGGLLCLVLWRRTRNGAWLLRHYRFMSGAYSGLLVALGLRVLPMILGGDTRAWLVPGLIGLLVLTQGSVTLADRFYWRPRLTSVGQVRDQRS